GEHFFFRKLDRKPRHRPRRFRPECPRDVRPCKSCNDDRDRYLPGRPTSRRPRGCFSLDQGSTHHRFDLDPYIRRRVPAFLRVLLEAALQQLDEARIQPRRQLREIDLHLQYRGEDLGRRLALERLTTAEHFEEDAAERENVAALISLEPFCLLGR